MELIHGFVATNKFYDDANFPYGFSKSGFFSIAESALLTEVGQRLCALEQGVAMPDNQVEKNFLDMVEGKAEPSTRVELVWMKYKKHARRKATKTLGTVTTDASRDDIEYDEVG